MEQAEALIRTLRLVDEIMEPRIQALEDEAKAALAKRMGGNVEQYRTSSIIAAAIKSSSLTLNEMGQILGAITDVICATACGRHSQHPELEETAHDLALTCESFAEAQKKIDDRLYEKAR